MTAGHIPVMRREVLASLAPNPGETIVDGTVGLGGHAVEILSRLGEDGLLIGIDRDSNALAVAEERLRAVAGRFRLIQGPFSRLREHLATVTSPPEGSIDGLLLDLGVSSMQLDSAERGFAFRSDGPLDMRMDSGSGETAAELVARLSVAELTRILRTYGEERAARRIALAIDRERRRAPIATTGQLASLVESVQPRAGQRIHPATRTFQALRIAVNRELEELESTLRDADRFVRDGGRLVVLSYHSLEDGIVKRTIGEGVAQGLWRWAFDGVARPEEDEVAANPRARSARMRAAVRGRA